MVHNFTTATLGNTGLKITRLGLAATYRPGKETIHRAIDEGLNYFFFFGLDTQMTGALREMLRGGREKFVVATGAYNYIWGYQSLRRTLEKRLRQLRTDYIDVFHFLGVMKPKEFPERVRDELRALREDGRVRAVSASIHNRKFAGELAERGELDALMIRYNAAHRGAENEIFPFVARHNTGIVSYTATRWRYLLRRPRGWPRDGRIPTASMCYRFALSHPNVDVCLMAPGNRRQLDDNLAALRQGPLADDEMEFMHRFGDAVHRSAGWFM